MSDKVDALVIFGATGDLAKLETFPALVGLVKRGVLDVPVIGVAKSGWGLEQFRDYAAASLKLNGMDPADPAAAKMLSLLRYVDGDLGDDATYKAMSDEIGAGQQVLFYLEVPPVLFGRIAQGIATAGRATGNRVMVEKPFGTDLDSAVELNELMHQYFPEEADLPGRPLAGPGPGGERAVRPVRQLGHRATAQPDLRGEHPDHDGRGVRRRRPRPVLRPHRRHPRRGAEPHAAGAGHRAWPIRRTAAGLAGWRDAKARLVAAIRPLTPEDAVRGQYEGYHEVDGVDPRSTMETFVAIRLTVDSWRWAGVPILIRAGKCMPVTATEVSIAFKDPPQDVFGIEPERPADTLRFRVWPETRVSLALQGKKPGAGWEPQPEELVVRGSSPGRTCGPTTG